MRWPHHFVLIIYFLKEVKSLSLRKNNHYNRREILSKTAFVISSISVNPIAWAENEDEASLSGADYSNDRSNNRGRGGRPFAPLQALLPAARLKLWVDGVYSLSQDIATTQNQNERFKAVQLINAELSNPPKLFQGETIEKRASSSTAQLATGISSANKDQYQLNRKGLSLGDKMTAMMNQADVERQWGMLQYAESKREEGSTMRAAFNFYTRQISFSDEYVLTASKEERKKMIRKDELPTLTAVITSDLDQRDLYRNQFLTAIDDACAEAAYQVKQTKQEDVDVADIIELVNQAHGACDNWFTLIAPQDVEEAIKEVQLSK